jgi:protease-4
MKDSTQYRLREKNFASRLIIGLLAVIGGLAVFVFLVMVISLIAIAPAYKPMPEKVILEMDFEKQLVEYASDDPLARALMREATTVRDVVEALERASTDKRVVGLVAKVGAAGMGLAVIQEIRNAVMHFADSGKFAVAYSETFGEFGPGNGAYYLATAFDEIYLQPSGDLNLTGLMYETPFLRGTLDKLYVEPRMDHREEYKNAMNTFTERKYNQPHREAIQALMDSQFSQIISGIAEARGLSDKQVTTLIANAPLSGTEAVEADLVDALLYRDEVYELVKGRAKDAQLLYLDRYLKLAGRPHKKGAKIALIYGVGDVHRGSSSYDAMLDSPSMGSDTIAAAFRAAAADKKVKAIVFRVDSSGGSYVASDTIWREVVQAREAGKPVIVSMGNVAGSGGYFVSMAANKIVAQPGTITGSIGVYAGKLLTRQFWLKHTGITWDDVNTGNNATLWTGTHDYSPQQWQKVQDFLDRVYDDFTAKVAQDRQMNVEEVLDVAKGRIWSGADAKERGLIDELGGFDVALRVARTEAGLDPNAPFKITVFPHPKRLIDMIFEREPDSSESEAMVAATRQALEKFRPLYKMADETGLLEKYDVLRMPSLEPMW